MPLHRIRFYLRLALICIAVAIVEVMVWGIFWAPASDIVRSTKRSVERRAPNHDDHRQLPTIRDFSSIASRPLRRPLEFETAKSKGMTATGAKQPTSAAFRLLGTIIEPGRPSAILSDRLGRQEIKGIGEHVGDDTGPTIVEISSEQVFLDQGGVRTSLQLEMPPTIDSFREFAEAAPDGISSKKGTR